MKHELINDQCLYHNFFCPVTQLKEAVKAFTDVMDSQPRAVAGGAWTDRYNYALAELRFAADRAM
jgi:hypothetical protein